MLPPKSVHTSQENLSTQEEDSMIEEGHLSPQEEDSVIETNNKPSPANDAVLELLEDAVRASTKTKVGWDCG